MATKVKCIFADDCDSAAGCRHSKPHLSLEKLPCTEKENCLGRQSFCKEQMDKDNG